MGPLGAREAEVARFVGVGLSNTQIATRLFLSERTVDSHVRSILSKLRFSSRAQIAAWVASSTQQPSMPVERRGRTAAGGPRLLPRSLGKNL